VIRRCHSLNKSPEKCSTDRPDATDKRDIIYSKANIKLHHREEITYELDGAKRDDVHSLNHRCEPLHATLEARRYYIRDGSTSKRKVEERVKEQVRKRTLLNGSVKR